MNASIKICVPLLIIFALVSSCDIFSTRNPEAPDTERSSFQPPTSANIVINNFVNAVEEKNPENYSACFPELSDEDLFFEFVPSSEANSRFPELFSDWNSQTERSYFISLTSGLGEDAVSELKLNDDRFEILMPDSAVYVADYYFYVEHSQTSISKEFAGTMQLTLAPDDNQLWSVRRWIDAVNPEDTIETTWSILKANFSN